jgi:ornithine carbamoyltransferase
VPPDELKGRDYLRVNDWSADELRAVLELADELKALQKAHKPHRHLEGRTVGLIFDKHSTRTRVSFGVGIAQLGATSLPLSEGQLQLGRGETISDTGRSLSLYLDAIVIRTFRQADVDELAAAADVPVINGLTDEFHPCQALADLMTIRERFGTLQGIRVAYLGDGNNVCHSLMVACAKLGLDFVAATPHGYGPSSGVARWAFDAAARSGGSVSLLDDPRAAAKGADVLYTDVWTSMGQEDENDRRLRDFRGFAIDRDVVSLASARAIVMHCLPAHRGEEIAADVLEGPRSAVWEQAENRLHTQKALLALVVP